jgi:hypothetical protein
MLPPGVDTAPMSTRIAGVRHTYQVGAHNVQPLLDALMKFDTMLTHASAQLGTDEKWYNDFLKANIQKSAQALNRYAADNDAAALQRALNGSMANLMGAQMRHTGHSPIYQTMFNESADSYTANLMERHGNTKYAALKRTDRMGRFSNRMVNPQAEGLVYRFEDRVKSGVAIGSNALWHTTVRLSREAQALYERTPYKAVVIGTAAMAGGTMVGIDLSGQAQEVFGPQNGQALEYASGLIGNGYGKAGTTITFGGYNIWDDTILTDTAGGVVSLTIGVAGHYTYNYTIRPVAAYVREQGQERITPQTQMLSPELNG